MQCFHLEGNLLSPSVRKYQLFERERKRNAKWKENGRKFNGKGRNMREIHTFVIKCQSLLF